MWRVSSVLELNGLSTAHKRMDEIYRTRGTAIHTANEALAEGYTPIVERPEWQGYVDGLADWYRKFEPRVVALERRIINRVAKCTGRIDLFAVVEEDPYVVDVKTGGEAAWHGIQTGGYHMLAIDDDELWKMFGEPWSRLSAWDREKKLKRACLYLPGDGKSYWRRKADPQDCHRFRAALDLTRYRYEHGLLLHVDPEQPDDDVKVIITPSQPF